jgi:CheY-like chemotaxis protein
LELAIINLTINARDAMPNGGNLRIATETAVFGENTIGDHSGDYLPEGYYTILTVTDTGTGIAQETMGRIFEPFFTTKEQGKGTGLGLAMVHGFVKQSGGTVLVDSTLNEETSFKLYFPMVYDPASSFDMHEKESIAPSKTSGAETILLVEDEEDVRNITRDILQLFGYKVIACEAVEALPLCQEMKQADNGRIHLLLTDIIMPGINGYELAQQMTPLCPNLKIVYMSGYANEILSKYGEIQQDVHFIPKPFTPQELTQKIRTVLDG